VTHITTTSACVSTVTSVTTNTWSADCISVKGLNLYAGEAPPRLLLRDAAFTITKHDRVVVLGRNGVGKSTLFAWLGLASKSSTTTKTWSVYEVAQELEPSPASVVNVVLSAHRLRGRLWERQAWLEAQPELSDDQVQEYTEVGEQLASMSAHADPARVRRILHGLGFSAEDVDQPLAKFSGGWRARAALAQGLFMQPDLLLLDEPTNHLDLAGTLWLSEYLTHWPTTLVVVTHNAGFARTVGTAVWLFDGHAHALQHYASYASYLRLRREAEDKAAKAWALYDKQVSALKRKGTPAAKKALEDLALAPVPRPPKAYAPKFLLHCEDAVVGDRTRVPYVSTDAAVFGYRPDRPAVLTNVSLALYPGQRVALVGANGSGKTTLVKVFSGDDGVVLGGEVRRRQRVRVVIFDQHFYHTLPPHATAIEYVLQMGGVGGTGIRAAGMGVMDSGGADSVSVLDVALARKLLGASGLEGKAHTQTLHTLSGGQKARVYFAGIAIRQPDLLLMDEPTNHLDMETVQGLADSLAEFNGAAVVVSHDLDFLEQVATDVWWTKDSTVAVSAGIEALEDYVDSVVDVLEE
jgi:ATPase subunit of ABC transporter with duplicated ATPase domains